MGNIDAKRDWGHAKDYVRMQWLMLQQDQAEDFVIATGETHSLAEFVQYVFAAADLNWHEHVDHDESLMRPTDIRVSRANTSKAADELGWRAQTRMPEIARLMVEAERSKN